MLSVSASIACDGSLIGRRVALAGGALLSQSLPSTNQNPPDTGITGRIYLDLGICKSNVRPSCTDSEPLGRILIGLYGSQAPYTAGLFRTACAAGVYRGTVFHKVIPGRYIQAGHQGSREKGEVSIPRNIPLDRNLDTADPGAFVLRHDRPGVVSLSLGDNDDDDVIRMSPNYRNVEFMITTGPGPTPDLDNRNIVFGTVLQGMDVVRTIASMPTFKPSERVREFNGIAEILGDDRAANARGSWYRPVRPIVIVDCGQV